jgi:hypothetical protein
MKPWDRELERFARDLQLRIVADGAHLHEEALARDRVPVFLSRGFERKSYQVAARADVLRLWEGNPDNGPEDLRFFEALRRADLPAGSFFVLVLPP